MRELADSGLVGLCVLIVEDDFLIALALGDALAELGIQVLGPVASEQQALGLLTTAPRIDAALLDVNLGGHMAYAVADELIRRCIPFVFATGYDPHIFPARFSGIACRQKPLNPLTEVRRLLAAAMPVRRA